MREDDVRALDREAHGRDAVDAVVRVAQQVADRCLVRTVELVEFAHVVDERRGEQEVAVDVGPPRLGQGVGQGEGPGHHVADVCRERLVLDAQLSLDRWEPRHGLQVLDPVLMAGPRPAGAYALAETGIVDIGEFGKEGEYVGHRRGCARHGEKYPWCPREETGAQSTLR